MKKTTKFYQAIAPAILFLIYTTTIFGSEKTTLSEVTKKVPKAIWNLVDEFCNKENKNGKKKLHDTFYKETGHLKPYSRLLDFTLPPLQQRESLREKYWYKKFQKYTTVISFSLVSALIFHLMLIPKLSSTVTTLYSHLLDLTMPYKHNLFKKFLPFKNTMKVLLKFMKTTAIISLSITKLLYHTSLHISYKIDPIILKSWPYFLPIGTGIIIDYVITKLLYNYYLAIKSPTQIKIYKGMDLATMSDKNYIGLVNLSSGITETRSLSDMRFKQIKHPIFASYFFTNKQQKKANGLTYDLKDRKINIYLPGNDYLPPKDDLPKHNYESEYRPPSLSTPNGVISFDVSEDKNILVALDQKGSLYKLELKNRPSLHEIMDSE